MSNDFLGELASAVGSQFSMGENTNHSLDILENGTTQRYGKLGDFANKFDQSQERKYLEEGYLRFDPYNVSVKQLEVLMQEPDITVLVKKRAFSTLSESSRLDHLDTDEKLFYKASKILFQNKCNQISAVEKLSKISRITTETGEIAKQLFPLILSLVDEIGNTIGGSFTTSTEQDVLNGTFTSGFGKLQSVINQVRKVYNYTGNSTYTTWLSDTTNPFKAKLGQGSGVIEFTTISQINTNCSLGKDGNIDNASFVIQDPYNLMVITTTDIERALSDATNQVYNHKIFEFGKQSSNDMATALTKQLNDKRARRGASRIEFIINPDTIFGKRVQAIIEGSGEEIHFTYDSAYGLGSLAGGGVNISIESYKGGQDVGNQGLEAGGSFSEADIFKRIIETVFDSLQLLINSQSITSQENAKITNYARRKLRTHYLGKLIIQSMDQVHIYISSKSRLDTKILGGLQSNFTGLGFLQNLNNGISNFKDQFQSLFDPAANTNFQLEKSVIVGSDFPNWLWTILRSQFVNDTGGTHVFAGIVSGSRSDYNTNAGYSASINIDNNMKYLDFGYVNFKPSADVFNGPFFDPFTPFKTTSDSVSGSFKKETPKLLEENANLLQEQVIKFKSGPHTGQLVTEDLLLKDIDKEKDQLGNTRNIYNCPDGFAYRWKEGIGTLVHLSDNSGFINKNSIGSPSYTVNPFAGQDVMNVISLSITGVPYNFSTFIKAARKVNGFSRDIQSGSDSAHSYYRSLTSDLSKNNALWGNFIPFKNLSIDEASFEKVLTAQISISQSNDKITRLLEDVKNYNNLAMLSKNTTADVEKYNAKRKLVEDALTPLYAEVQSQLEKSTNQSLSIVGNDVSYDSDEFLSSDTKNNSSLTNPNIRRDLRKKLNFLTRRLSWSVRANEDKNLFIVDDAYDKDYDLIAFDSAMNNKLNAFNSEYDSVKTKVTASAKLLDLEVFCDTQGHIRVRPPQYNRMPSSVFYNLFKLKQQTGIQIFPQFLEDLFTDQIQGMMKNISIIEDQIRLDAAVLGKNEDKDVYDLIRGTNFIAAGTSLADADYQFITEQVNGSVVGFDILNEKSDPEKLIASKGTQSFIDQLKKQAGNKKSFNTIIRTRYLVDLTKPGSKPLTISNNTRIDELFKRLKRLTGQQPTLDNFLYSSYDGSIKSSESVTNKVDPFKVTNDLAEKVSQRQKLVKLAANALKNATEYLSLDDDKSISNKLLFPNIAKNSNIPQVFESMVEDESYDDYGPGSGSRYIIKDYQIYQITITETPPEFTSVEVKGQLDPFLPNSLLPPGLSISLTGHGADGNSLISAAAIDYDLWRMYGLRQSRAFEAPFLSHPDSQCAPYAAMILSRSRKNILQGHISIVGNEYMQPGDVIYLESRDMLFYVDKVSHNFSYSGNGTFKTTLDLTYGHVAGDYIPTTLDIIGKLIYNNRDASHFVNYRQNNVNQEQPLGIITVDSRSSDTDINNKILNGTYGSQNIAVITNIKNICQAVLEQNKVVGNTKLATIELRVYYTAEPNSVLSQAAAVVQSLLTSNNTEQTKNPLVNTDIILDSNYITPYPVNISSDDYRSPSQQAIDMVKNMQSMTGAKTLKEVLFGYIIDCWITFKEI